MYGAIILGLLASASLALKPVPLLGRQSDCSAIGQQTCGDGCVPTDYTCCPDQKEGCPTATDVCQLGSNGEYGCCPIGQTCTGPGGAVTSTFTITSSQSAQSVSEPSSPSSPSLSTPTVSLTTLTSTMSFSEASSAPSTESTTSSTPAVVVTTSQNSTATTSSPTVVVTAGAAWVQCGLGSAVPALVIAVAGALMI